MDNRCLFQTDRMKLSIITINYNNRDGLQRTIDSVICQTWRDFEWIIIDGGSTDGSKELIEKYQDHFAYWCSEPDKGVYNAMNKGVAKAQGEYLNFMNSGDCLHSSTALEEVFCQPHTADIVSCQAVRLESGQPLRHYDENPLMQVYCDTLNHQATFIRRKLLLQRPYDENLKIVSDWKFWLEAILYDGATVEYSKVVVSNQDMTGISNTQSEMLFKERRDCINKILPLPLQQILNDYRWLRNWEDVQRLDYLRLYSPLLFRVARKTLKVLMRIATKKC